MRIMYAALAGSIFLVLFGCKKNVEVRNSSSVSWKNCSQIENKTDDVKVCLDSLIEDSRCPLGVICVWEGTAIARFSVTVNGQQQPVTLSTLNMPGYHPSDTILMGYKIEFFNLSPYPEVGKTHDILEYKAELNITKQ